MTTNANNIAAGENTVEGGKTLTFSGGTLERAITGEGNTTFAGDVTADADNIATAGTNTVNSGKTLTFNGGTLLQKIQGASNTTFDGNVIANANNIATTGTNTIADGATLVFNGGALTKTIAGAGNVIFDTDMSVDFVKLANTGFWAVNTGKTLTSTGETTLAKNIAGAGTVKLGGTMNVTGNQSIEGTLDGNGKILNMTNNAPGSHINYLTAGTLKGNTDLQLDVDLSRLTSDMILANAVDSGATINVKSTNITADNPAGMLTVSDIIFLTENGGTPTHGTYTVNSSTGSITMTNTRSYKFELGWVNHSMKCNFC